MLFNFFLLSLTNQSLLIFIVLGIQKYFMSKYKHYKNRKLDIHHNTYNQYSHTQRMKTKNLLKSSLCWHISLFIAYSFTSVSTYLPGSPHSMQAADCRLFLLALPWFLCISFNVARGTPMNPFMYIWAIYAHSKGRSCYYNPQVAWLVTHCGEDIFTHLYSICPCIHVNDSKLVKVWVARGISKVVSKLFL